MCSGFGDSVSKSKEGSNWVRHTAGPLASVCIRIIMSTHMQICTHPYEIIHAPTQRKRKAFYLLVK